MPGDASPWDPNAWEKHIQRALKLRYAQPVGTYQHIAAESGGDYGLEGFAADGTAYQCYACQSWPDSAFLLKKQKTKMTADIGKLIKNEAELLKILGDIRIGIWNFVLPFWSNKELLIHANKKTEEVRKRGPQHVTKDFRISVITGEEFALEIKALANQDLYQFDVKDVPDSVAGVAKWFDDNKGLVMAENLTRKTTVIAQGRSERMRQKFRARYYNATLQRFISEDPAGLGGGDVNLYGYSLDNPVNFTDPTGLATVVNSSGFPVMVSGNPGAGHGEGVQVFGVVPPDGHTYGGTNPIVGYPTIPDAIDAYNHRGPHQPAGNISDIDFYCPIAGRYNDCTPAKTNKKIDGDDLGPNYTLKDGNGNIVDSLDSRSEFFKAFFRRYF